MTTIGTAFPAQIFVAEAEVRLVADQTAHARPVAIKADEQAVAAAEQTAAHELKSPPLVDVTT